MVIFYFLLWQPEDNHIILDAIPAYIPADRITVCGRISVVISGKSYVTPACHAWGNAT